MSREIKFRFWDGEKMLSEHDHASFWNGLLVCEGDTIPIQFTGLKDKNGKEIYEGDIVTLPDTESHSVDVGIGPSMKVAETLVKTIASVEFNHGTFGFVVTDKYSEEWHVGFNPFALTDYSLATGEMKELAIEVIGNIYETPELIPS